VAAATLAVSTASAVTLYPGPAGEPASQDYQVTVDGRPCFCYTSYRFDTTSGETIQGRPVSPVSFCYFDADGPADVEVRMLEGLCEAGIDCSRVVVRPLAQGIQPEVKGGIARFRAPGGPCQLSVEPGGDIRHPLHIFANPPERDAPDPRNPGVLYFGPGAHEAAEVDIEDGQTVYIAGGAVVSLKPQPPPNRIEASASAGCYGLDLSWGAGLFAPRWKKHVTVRGRGILCGRHALAQGRRGPLAVFEGCEDVTVEDIIIRESSVWSLNLSNCTRARVSNVKIVGHYVNNDGIAIGGTSEAVVEDCFTHNADDSLEVKVWIPQRNVLFRNVRVLQNRNNDVVLMADAAASPIDGITFDDVWVAGQRLEPGDPRIKINAWVTGVEVR